MNNAKQIFNYISGVNASKSTISSLGSFVTKLNQQVANDILVEVIKNVPTTSLAYKIATTHKGDFSDKQIWVMAFELVKNEEFYKTVSSFYAQIERKEAAKKQESKNKLTANKEASADVLAPIKAAKKLGDYGKWLNTSGNKFRKEHFSKKYTQASVNEFLQTI